MTQRVMLNVDKYPTRVDHNTSVRWGKGSMRAYLQNQRSLSSD